MSNPWLDPEYAARWSGRINAGNPYRDRQIGVACRLAAVGQPRRILDLGVGQGFVARRLLHSMPEARLTGLDGSAAMLDGALVYLERYAERVDYVEAALESAWPALTGGNFDLVLSVQTIHHLPGEAKRDCYAKVLEVVAPGGRFLVSDRLAIDPRRFEEHQALWNRERDHTDFARLPDDWTHERYVAALAENGDVPDRLETQLAWLREVGFEAVDTFWQNGDRAVFGGLKP